MPPISPPFAPQICASMIVKNEAAIIERCLTALKPFIGAYAIVDTGSTDGTQDIIRRVMGDMPGALIERPWIDFATNRNQALDLARGFGDYAFSIDADSVLQLDPTAPWPQRLDADGYSIEETIDGHDFTFRTYKLMRHAALWRWQGVLHEYTSAPNLGPIPPLPGVRVIGMSDGGRSQRPLREKYLDDVRVLEAALVNEPNNDRYVFYLAQSLRDAGEHARALDAYRRRADMGGWDEELYYARLEIGLLLEKTGAPIAQIIDAHLAAFETRPRRAESLCALARVLRVAGRHASAHVIATRAAAIPLPDDLLFVDPSVYRWRARDELSIAAWYIGEKAQSADLCRALLADPALPAAERERVEANLRWATDA